MSGFADDRPHLAPPVGQANAAGRAQLSPIDAKAAPQSLRTTAGIRKAPIGRVDVENQNPNSDPDFASGDADHHHRDRVEQAALRESTLACQCQPPIWVRTVPSLNHNSHHVGN
jgi:hypothetical protein